MVKYFKLTQEKNERESIEERFSRTLLLRNGCLLEANWHLLFQVDAVLLLDYSKNRYTNSLASTNYF